MQDFRNGVGSVLYPDVLICKNPPDFGSRRPVFSGLLELSRPAWRMRALLNSAKGNLHYLPKDLL